MSRTIAITGSASGIGAALGNLLQGRGHRVIGVDLRDAEVSADLSTPSGRRSAADAVSALAAPRVAVVGSISATQQADSEVASSGASPTSPACATRSSCR